MKKKTKIFISIMLFFVVTFVLYHSFWHFVVLAKSEEFSNADEFQEIHENLSYLLTDGEIVYNVEYPFYLSLTGNLAVQANEGDFALIIWPQVFGATTFGFMMFNSENNQSYEIELDENRNALDEDFLPVVNEHSEIIDYLFERAYKMWGIDSHGDL